MKQYWFYILSSRNRVLYVGVTNDLRRRIAQHKSRLVPGFSARYKVDRLVYFEGTGDVFLANAGEKQIKGWRRDKKTALIATTNPHWDDLSAGVSS
ncbi:MAG: excinuclease ABC subunit C [Acidobacteria bacterium RBG_13_68_16]|nr:MAG: excinuclease ABC subunit C [Acidobacteria bacterium RBG_13_68_16]